jgi:hypothetical protein
MGEFLIEHDSMKSRGREGRHHRAPVFLLLFTGDAPAPNQPPLAQPHREGVVIATPSFVMYIAPMRFAARSYIASQNRRLP